MGFNSAFKGLRAIKGHPNINMENEIVSSGPRKPLIHSLKEWRKPPHEDIKPFQGQQIQALHLLAIPPYYLNGPLVSSHSFYISALLLSPNAILCFPYILEAQHMTPPIPQHHPSYWLLPYIIQPNSPSNLYFFAHHKLEAASSYTPSVTNYQSTKNHIPVDCKLHQQCCENLKSNLLI
jgi:hypothetical protein